MQAKSIDSKLIRKLIQDDGEKEGKHHDKGEKNYKLVNMIQNDAKNDS